MGCINSLVCVIFGMFEEKKRGKMKMGREKEEGKKNMIWGGVA